MNSGSRPTARVGKPGGKLIRLTALILGLVCLGSAVDGQEIYKQVLPDGTVVYSDQRPTPNAEPIVLPELTLITSQSVPQTSGRSANNSDEADSTDAPYAEFALVEPVADQTYWNTGYTITPRVNDFGPLSSAYRVRFIVDGETRGETRARSMLLSDIYRGEHSIQAQIVGTRGDIVATTAPVTFHMKQTSSRQ